MTTAIILLEQNSDFQPAGLLPSRRQYLVEFLCATPAGATDCYRLGRR